MNDLMLLPHLKFRFNINHPSFEECYVYGYECALAEVSESENPFSVGSKGHGQWADGWWAGFYGEAPLFSLEDLAQPVLEPVAANDKTYHEVTDNFFIKLLEISGVIAVSAFVGYQLIELVA